MKTLLALACLVAAAAVPVRGATLEAMAGLGGVAKAGRRSGGRRLRAWLLGRKCD